MLPWKALVPVLGAAHAHSGLWGLTLIARGAETFLNINSFGLDASHTSGLRTVCVYLSQSLSESSLLQ